MNLLELGDYRQSLMVLAIVMTRITTIMIITPFFKRHGDYRSRPQRRHPLD